MADIIGELIVQITADTKDYNKNIDKTEKRTNQVAKTTDKLAAGLKGMFAGVGIALVVSKLKDLGAASVKASSDLGESVNAVNVVYGDSAKIIKNWGDVAAEQAGLSKAAFNESSALIGTLLKKTGKSLNDVAFDTIEVTKRSADLASVFNKDLSVATTAVGAALRGETEPIRAFAIDVSAAAVEAEALASGLINNKKELTEAIKVQARYNLILKQSQNVAGDFAKTNDQLANSSRVLKAELENAGAELGETFLPTVTKAATSLVSLTRAMGEQAPIINNVLTKAWINLSAGIDTAIVKLSGIFGLHIKIYDALLKQVVKLGKAVIKPFIVIGATVAKIYAEIINATSKFGASIEETFIVAINSVKLSFISLGSTIVNNVLGSIEKLLGVASKIPLIGKKFDEANNSVKGIKSSFNEASDAAIKLQEDAVNAAKKDKQAADETYQAKLDLIESEKQAKLDALNTEVETKQEATKKIIETEKEETDETIALREAEATRLAEIALKEFDDREALKEKEKANDKERRLARIEQRREEAQFILDSADNISQILSNLNTKEINEINNKNKTIIDGIENGVHTKIQALDKEALGEKAYEEKVTQIKADAEADKQESKKQTALKVWEIEKEQFNIGKALALSQIAVDTAIGVAKVYGQTGIFGLGAQIPVIAAGALQAGVVLSQPEPPRPAYKAGGYVPYQQGGVNAIIAEEGDEEVFGMGASGVPRRKRFASEVAAMVSANSGDTFNFYGKSMLSNSEMTNFAQQFRPFQIKENQRRGAN